MEERGVGLLGDPEVECDDLLGPFLQRARLVLQVLAKEKRVARNSGRLAGMLHRGVDVNDRLTAGCLGARRGDADDEGVLLDEVGGESQVVSLCLAGKWRGYCCFCHHHASRIMYHSFFRRHLPAHRSLKIPVFLEEPPLAILDVRHVVANKESGPARICQSLVDLDVKFGVVGVVWCGGGVGLSGVARLVSAHLVHNAGSRIESVFLNDSAEHRLSQRLVDALGVRERIVEHAEVNTGDQRGDVG